MRFPQIKVVNISEKATTSKVATDETILLTSKVSMDDNPFRIFEELVKAELLPLGDIRSSTELGTRFPETSPI
jgi:hypothetical protein